MNYGFIIDNRKCIGCHACTVACKSEHDVAVGVNRTWVKYIEKGEYPNTRRIFSVTRCNHCDNAPCVAICPVAALYTRKDGIVDFDNQRCIGCKSCMQACPYDALYIDPKTETAAKCNYCAHRVDTGMEPACVVVCPEQAIISGDMDNPAAKISQLLSRQQVTVRKPEKGTKPKLFYIGGDEAALTPTQAPPGSSYLWAEQSQGVGHFAKYAQEKASTTNPERLLALLNGGRPAPKGDSPGPRVRRAYDAPQKGVLWGWEVSGYLWTKSIAAGLLISPLLLSLLGRLSLTPALELSVLGVSMLMLVATALLLVKDLDQPQRFLYVMLRPQWNSWLMRGGYIMAVTGGLLTLWGVDILGGLPAGGEVVRWGLVVFGVLAATYTAFLFAQAKGRDFWQSPALPFHMLVQSVMMGSAAVLIVGHCAGLAGWGGLDSVGVQMVTQTLSVAIGVHLALLLVEFSLTHSSGDGALAAHMILAGRFAPHFWGAVIGGNLLPLGLLSMGGGVSSLLAAAGLVLMFGLVLEHIWVRAPQLIPLK
ncbi:MAG: polysulfide reductase NrfD [Deltaproteobacteria bacterium]|nr:polysulfide reductase NrfD [Deltaproteobacteria bacterium]